MISLVDAIARYSTLRMGGYAPTTLKAHRGLLHRFSAWVSDRHGPQIGLDEVNHEVTAAYMERLYPPRFSASTFNNYRQYLAQFFAHCRAEGWIASDPMRYIRPTRTGRRVRLQLTAAECLRMLEVASPRDRIALALGMTTALRAGDITALKVGDVDLPAGYVFARIRKTASEDRLPITADLEAALREWLPKYAAAMDVEQLPGDWTLVPPAHWQAANVHAPQGPGRVVYMPLRRYRHPEQIVQRALASIGYPTFGEGFHTLRRTAARLVYDLAATSGSESPIRVTQAFLGHQSQETTERYVQIGREQRARDRLLIGRWLLGP